MLKKGKAMAMAMAMEHKETYTDRYRFRRRDESNRVPLAALKLETKEYLEYVLTASLTRSNHA